MTPITITKHNEHYSHLLATKKTPTSLSSPPIRKQVHYSRVPIQKINGHLVVCAKIVTYTAVLITICSSEQKKNYLHLLSAERVQLKKAVHKVRVKEVVTLVKSITINRIYNWN